LEEIEIQLVRKVRMKAREEGAKGRRRRWREGK